MEQKSKVLTAVIALVTLVVGVFIGMGVQGGAFGQGKLTWMKDKGATQCEQYKAMFYQGTLTSTLGVPKTTQVLNNCTKNFAEYWNAMPTLNECYMLKNRFDYYGAAEFSKYLTNVKLSQSNVTYCSKMYPYTWYGTGMTGAECYSYKNFAESGGDITKLLSLSKNKGQYGLVMKSCANLIGWPTTKPKNVNPSTCMQYKKWADQNVLSDMIKAGTADQQIAVSCSGYYPLIWNGVSKAQCQQFKVLLQQGTFTSTLGVEKSYDAGYACINAGYDLSKPIN